MDRDPRAYLWDVRESADAITQFVAGRTFEEYVADRMLRSAVERQFEIVGEALRQLTRAAPELAAELAELPQAIAFRNILIHGYTTIDDRIAWRVIRESLPVLRGRGAALLDQASGAYDIRGMPVDKFMKLLPEEFSASW